MQARLAYAAAGAAEKPAAASAENRAAQTVSGRARKTLVMIEGAGHNDIAMSERYFEAIARFLDEAIAGASGSG